MVRYRNDIDGLRALAIIPVVLFHYGFTKIAPGGFAGVDIFFVISGFLITKNIQDDINSKSYSVLDFYNRRIRRIFPALFVMFLFCLVCALLIQIPEEAKETGNGIIGSTLFFSNIMFYNMSGYFDQQMQNNPLLHTWSLSVEEQFYVIMPLFLLLLQNVRDKTRSFIILAALALSFLVSVYTVFHDESAAFYLVQNRAWELLMGSFLAIGGLPALSNKRMQELLGVAGLALILGSVLLISHKILFPGPSAVPPCLGAALVLYSGAHRETAVARLLAYPPLRFIGLVSYSFYLWHWPVRVFALNYFVPDALESLALIALAFGLSVLSWRFIERPFRVKPFRLNARATVGTAGALMAAVSVLAFTVAPLNAKLWRYPANVGGILAYLNYTPTSMRDGTCFLSLGADKSQSFKIPTCLNINPAEKNYLLIGDSHAADLWYGLATDYPDINFLQATASYCKPTLGTPGRKFCTDLRDYIFQDFIPQHHLDGIIISARWDGKDIDDAIKTAQSFLPYANQVIILGPVAEYDQPLPLLLARSISKNNPNLLSNHLVPGQQVLDAKFQRRLTGSGITYVSVYSAMCPQDKCIALTSGNIPMQFDEHHFTAAGAVFVAARLNFLPGKAVAQN